MPTHQLTKAAREGLLEWMKTTLNNRLAADIEKIEMRAIEAANKAIRAKYPEEDMVVLRKYKCVHIDNCLRFVNDTTGQVFGVNFDWNEREKGRLADLPSGGGCNRNDVFRVSASAQKTLETFTAKREDHHKERESKRNEYFSFLASCKTLDDVDGIIKLPDDIKARYAKSGALVAINPDVIASIKRDFAKAA